MCYLVLVCNVPIKTAEAKQVLAVHESVFWFSRSSQDLFVSIKFVCLVEFQFSSGWTIDQASGFCWNDKGYMTLQTDTF